MFGGSLSPSNWQNLSLTGYAGGVDRKAALLKLEGIELKF